MARARDRGQLGLHDGEAFRQRYPTVRYVQGDACALPFADGEFDLYFSNAVIEHVGGGERQRAFVAEALRVAPRVFITTPNRWFPSSCTRGCRSCTGCQGAAHRACDLARKGWAKENHLLGPGDLRDLFPVPVRIVNLGTKPWSRSRDAAPARDRARRLIGGLALHNLAMATLWEWGSAGLRWMSSRPGRRCCCSPSHSVWHCCARALAAVAGGGPARGRLRWHHRRLRPDSTRLAGRRRDDAGRAACAAPPPDPGRRVRARAPARDDGARAAMAPVARGRGRRCAGDLGLRRCIPRLLSGGGTPVCPAGTASSWGSTTKRRFPGCPRTGSMTRRRVEPAATTHVHVPQPVGDRLRARRRAARPRRPASDALDGRRHPRVLRRALVDAHESGSSRSPAGLVVLAVLQRRWWPLAAAAASLAAAFVFVKAYPTIGPSTSYAGRARISSGARPAGGRATGSALARRVVGRQSLAQPPRRRPGAACPQGYGLEDTGVTAKRTGVEIKAGGSRPIRSSVSTQGSSARRRSWPGASRCSLSAVGQVWLQPLPACSCSGCSPT